MASCYQKTNEYIFQMPVSWHSYTHVRSNMENVCAPVKRDGWYETIGKLRGNETVDMMGWGGPIPRKLRFHDPSDYKDPLLIHRQVMGQKDLHGFPSIRQ